MRNPSGYPNAACPHKQRGSCRRNADTAWLRYHATGSRGAYQTWKAQARYVVSLPWATYDRQSPDRLHASTACDGCASGHRSCILLQLFRHACSGEVEPGELSQELESIGVASPTELLGKEEASGRVTRATTLDSTRMQVLSWRGERELRNCSRYQRGWKVQSILARHSGPVFHGQHWRRPEALATPREISSPGSPDFCRAVLLKQ